VYADDEDSLPPMPERPAPEISKWQRVLGLVGLNALRIYSGVATRSLKKNASILRSAVPL
jgi:hypothetical protein